MISAFLNTVMQEMLVRGYLYQMLKSNYNIGIAVIVSTGLFTFAHGGAFEAGILSVLNVITMSLLYLTVLEYDAFLNCSDCNSFLWNGEGAIILGGVSLCKKISLNILFAHGSEWGIQFCSGGSCKIEGSIVVASHRI
ncbi:MAG: type II CAAX prenyl endopeptidase Rce1 family protein [Dorea sp.]